MSQINVDSIRSQTFIESPVDLNGTQVTYNSNTSMIGIGNGALQSCTGINNVALGKSALQSLTTGDDNTAIGHSSLSLTTGNNNTAIGHNAGVNNTTGVNNTFIGSSADGASATDDNTVTLGNSSITTLRCAVTTITSLSDARDKKNIEESKYGLDIVESLKPVTFEWNTRDGAKKDIKDLGFIAQDLKEIDDDYLGLVYESNPEKLEASYGRLIPILVKAIQELSEEIKKIKNEHP